MQDIRRTGSVTSEGAAGAGATRTGGSSFYFSCMCINFLFDCLRSGGCSKTDRRTEEGERGEAAIGAAAVGPPDAFRRRNRKSGKVAIEIGEFDVDEGQPEFV